MSELVVAESERAFAYDVQLRRRPPRSLRARFPSMKVRTLGAQTALRRRVERSGQLEAMLEKLSSLGLVVTEVHRLPAAGRVDVGAAGDTSATQTADLVGGPGEGVPYEVRVAGELGKPLLRYLRWSHYAVPARTVVRLAVPPAELTGFLQACTDCGASIERVRRVESSHGPG